MKVSQCMAIGVVCVRPSSTLVEAGTLMRHLGTTALPVCELERLTGLLTDRDLAVYAATHVHEPTQAHVSDAMSSGVPFVFDEDDAADAARMMEHRQIFRLPVLNRDLRLVGMLALSDLEAALAAEFHPASHESSPPCSDR